MFNFDTSVIILSLTVFGVTFLISILLTLRSISLIKGLKLVASILIFFETVSGLIVGITIISQAIKNGINFFVVLFYGLGYASGLLLGIYINQRLTKSLISINVITKKPDTSVEDLLREKGFGVTCYTGSGKEGNVKVLNIICKNTDLKKINKIVINSDKKAVVASHLIEGLNGGFISNASSRS